MTTVPTSLAEIDAAWLGAAMRRPVDELRAEPLGDGASFLGDLARLHVRFTDGEDDRLIAKVPTADTGGRKVGRLLDVWRREHRFYTELAADLEHLVPRCRVALGDEVEDRWILVLDEIHPARELDQLAGAGLDDLGVVTDAIADLHGRYDDRTAGSPPWMPGIDSGTAGLLRDAVVGSLDAWERRFGELLPDGFAATLRDAAPRLDRWLAAQAQRPLALAHADVRVDNLVFPERGGVRLIDWQTAMRTNGVTDLAILLATSATIDDRRAWEDELLHRYADGVARHGVALDTDQLRADYAESFLWWSSMFANNLSTIDPPPGRGRDLFDSMVERAATAAVDHGASWAAL
ncbi:MAG: oxidoreductase family protein [Actinomycetota bacterium]